MSEKKDVFDAKAADSNDADSKDTGSESNEDSTLSVVEAKMADIMAKTRGEESTPPVEDTDESKDSEDEDSEVEEDDSDTDDTEDDSDAKDDGSAMLPKGHRKSALSRGYTEEEIDYYLKSDPKEAVTRFGKIYDEWLETNIRYSDAGRKLRDAQRLAAEREQGTEKKSATEKVASDSLAPIDAKALIEKYGQEDLINEIVGPLNKSIAEVISVAERLAKSEEFLQDTKQNALGDAIQEFFASKEMTPYKKTYGTAAGNLTEKQIANRTELFGQADILSAGALDHGAEITVREALERAHMIVSHSSIDETIRQGLKAKMKKRTKSVRSSHKKTAPGSGQDKTMNDLEKQVAAKQQSLLGR